MITLSALVAATALGGKTGNDTYGKIYEIKVAFDVADPFAVGFLYGIVTGKGAEKEGEYAYIGASFI
jgi:hypothetical protein